MGEMPELRHRTVSCPVARASEAREEGESSEEKTVTRRQTHG
jgi:hypothetical protein